MNMHEKWQTLYNVELPVNTVDIQLACKATWLEEGEIKKYKCAKTFSMDWD